jgi:hypothetical protein
VAAFHGHMRSHTVNHDLAGKNERFVEVRLEGVPVEE